MSEKLLEGIKYQSGQDCDTVLTTRVRLARNISGYPFPIRAGSAERAKISEAVVSAAKKNEMDYKFKVLNASELSAVELASLAEKRLISGEFARSGGNGATVIADEKKGVYIMVNEEDHIRIQSIESGLAPNKAYAVADGCDNLLEETLNYAYDEKLGYLTECPTNLGTGMRVSVMLHLPVLSAENRIRAISANLIKLGLVMRGFYGEGSEGRGHLYQVSNQTTLGVTEEQAVEKLRNAALQLINLERAERDSNYRNAQSRFKDRVYRSYGTLRSAYILSVPEFLSLYSDVRLGISLGIITDLSYPTIDRLLTDLMPASLALLYNAAKDDDLDILRAEAVKNTLKI